MTQKSLSMKKWQVSQDANLASSTRLLDTPTDCNSAKWDTLSSCCGAALAAAALVMCVASQPAGLRVPSVTDVDATVGYFLIVVGYLLLPGVGIVLMRRQRAVAHNRNAVLSGTGDVVDLASTPDAGAMLCGSGLGGVFALLRLRRASNRVDACTTCRTWQGEDVQCAVCLSDVCRNSISRTLPCGHVFHKSCVDLWLVDGCHNSCPLCMSPVCSDGDRQLPPSR